MDISSTISIMDIAAKSSLIKLSILTAQKFNFYNPITVF